MSESCNKCKFFQSMPELCADGICRRYPRYIQRDTDDWCGEFKRHPDLIRMHKTESQVQNLPVLIPKSCRSSFDER